MIAFRAPAWLNRLIQIPAQEAQRPTYTALGHTVPDYPLSESVFRAEPAQVRHCLADAEVRLPSEALLVERRIAHIRKLEARLRCTRTAVLTLTARRGRLEWRLRRAKAALADDVARLRAVTDGTH